MQEESIQVIRWKCQWLTKFHFSLPFNPPSTLPRSTPLSFQNLLLQDFYWGEDTKFYRESEIGSRICVPKQSTEACNKDCSFIKVHCFNMQKQLIVWKSCCWIYLWRPFTTFLHYTFNLYCGLQWYILIQFLIFVIFVSLFFFVKLASSLPILWISKNQFLVSRTLFWFFFCFVLNCIDFWSYLYYYLSSACFGYILIIFSKLLKRET